MSDLVDMWLSPWFTYYVWLRDPISDTKSWTVGLSNHNRHSIFHSFEDYRCRWHATFRPRQPFHIKQTITNKLNSACASHLVLVKTPTKMGHEIIRPKLNRKQKSSNGRRRRSHGKHLGQLHNGHFSTQCNIIIDITFSFACWLQCGVRHIMCDWQILCNSWQLTVWHRRKCVKGERDGQVDAIGFLLRD